jgi:hypothetical protein
MSLRDCLPGILISEKAYRVIVCFLTFSPFRNHFKIVTSIILINYEEGVNIFNAWTWFYPASIR